MPGQLGALRQMQREPVTNQKILKLGFLRRQWYTVLLSYKNLEITMLKQREGLTGKKEGKKKVSPLAYFSFVNCPFQIFREGGGGLQESKPIFPPPTRSRYTAPCRFNSRWQFRNYKLIKVAASKSHCQLITSRCDRAPLLGLHPPSPLPTRNTSRNKQPRATSSF